MMVRKVIRISGGSFGFDEIVADYILIIDTPEFQRLREIKQLDLVYKVFGAATHTRFEHSIGTLHHQRNIMRSIQFEEEAYKFNELEKRTLELAALLHDIGHPPFSHAIEDVLMRYGEPDHDKKSIEILERLKPQIKKLYNVEDREEGYELLLNIFERKNPMHQIIWGLVGSDKLDYITRDAERCGVSISSDVERIEACIYFDGKNYGPESTVKRVVRHYVESYLHLYFDVYLRKSVLFWRGVLRRAMCDAIKKGKIKTSEVHEMTDAELLASLASSGEIAQKLYKRIRNRERVAAFLTLKIEGQESKEEIRGKPLQVIGLPEKDLMKIVKYFDENVDNVIEFEEEVESLLGLEHGDIILTKMPLIRQIQPKDIPLWRKGSGWTSLFKEMPECEHLFTQYIKEEYALRIGAFYPYRKRAYEKSEKVFDILESLV